MYILAYQFIATKQKMSCKKIPILSCLWYIHVHVYITALYFFRSIKWLKFPPYNTIQIILPRVTDCVLVVDPRRLVAPQWYSPASVGAMLLMVSDGLLTIPPEYLALFAIIRFCPPKDQYTAVTAGEPLALQWMVTVVAASVIVPGTVTVGFPKCLHQNIF